MALKFRRLQLEWDLKHEDYSQIISVEMSKKEQLDAIQTLMNQIPIEIREELK